MKRYLVAGAIVMFPIWREGGTMAEADLMDCLTSRSIPGKVGETPAPRKLAAGKAGLSQNFFTI